MPSDDRQSSVVFLIGAYYTSDKLAMTVNKVSLIWMAMTVKSLKLFNSVLICCNRLLCDVLWIVKIAGNPAKPDDRDALPSYDPLATFCKQQPLI